MFCGGLCEFYIRTRGKLHGLLVRGLEPRSRKSGTPKWKLTCMTMSCRSAKSKIADIAAVIDQYKPDIIFGTESWLNSNIESNEIFPNGYKLFRKDRPDDCHGDGVFQAVKNDIIITRRSDLDSDCQNNLDSVSASRQENKITVFWIILSIKFLQR